MPWIQTFSGGRFSLDDPQPEDVCIEDILQALGQLVRFTGHCRGRYTVLEHSVRVANILPDELKYQGLLHDAPEAYYGDDSRPKKILLNAMTGGDYQLACEKIDRVVFAALGVPWPLDDAVQHADNILLATEARDLMLPPPKPWMRLPDALLETIVPVHIAASHTRFCEIFHKYKPQ